MMGAGLLNTTMSFKLLAINFAFLGQVQVFIGSVMFFLSPYPCPSDKWARKVDITQPAGTPLVPDNWT